MVIWRDVPGFPGYQASDEGQIRRTFVGGNGRKPGIVNGCPYSNGYWTVTLCVPGRPHKDVGVHCLVCAAFHGPKPTAAHEVAHWDGDKSNNRPDNLRWTTPRGNAADRRRHGRVNSKLTEADALEIWRLATAGERQRDIALRFGVHQATVHRIATGKSWPHLVRAGEFEAKIA